MDYKKWVELFVGMFVGALLVCMSLAIYIDPFFHYHKPHPDLYYSLKNERYQNDGIMRHFNYNAVITGTSVTEYFRTTEMDRLFDVNSIKVPFSGGSLKEVNDNLKVAYRTEHRVKCIIRSLDADKIFHDKDTMTDLFIYPYYLYNDTVTDDVRYIFNVDVLNECKHIIFNKLRQVSGGVTSFDKYATNGSCRSKCGRENVVRNLDKRTPPFLPDEITTVLVERIKANIKQNVLSLPEAHPETTFYYFFPPYNCVFWSRYSKEQLVSYVEAEKLVIEMLLPYNNVRLYSFDLNTDLTNNLNNYYDTLHYGEWVHSSILIWMKEGRGLITKDNYHDYLRKKEELLQSYSGKQY